MHNSVIRERSVVEEQLSRAGDQFFLEILKRGPFTTDPRIHNYDYIRTNSEFYNWNREICKLNGQISSALNVLTILPEVSQKIQNFIHQPTHLQKAGWEATVALVLLDFIMMGEQVLCGKKKYIKTKEKLLDNEQVCRLERCILYILGGWDQQKRKGKRFSSPSLYPLL